MVHPPSLWVSGVLELCLQAEQAELMKRQTSIRSMTSSGEADDQLAHTFGSVRVVRQTEPRQKLVRYEVCRRVRDPRCMVIVG